MTEVIRGRRRRVRRWLSGDAPPSLHMQLLLLASAFLCGGVLAALLFVGVWRHTAAEGERARATQATAQRQLLAAQHRLAAVQTQLARARAALGAAERRSTQATAELDRTRRADAAIHRSLPPRLQALVDAAGAIAHQTASLQSELAALETYAGQPGSAGLDPGYLGSQARYLATSAGTTASAAAALAQHARDAQAALKSTGK